MTGMMIAIPDQHWTVFQNFTPVDMAAVLKELARYVVLSKYHKHPRGLKKPQPKRQKISEGNHVSTARILAKRTQTK